MMVSVLEFVLKGEIYCFDTRLVAYLFDLESYEKVGAFAPSVLGIGRYNDEAMVLVDTCRLYCGKPLDLQKPKSVIVISDERGGIYGMVVDEILKIEEVEKAEITLDMNSDSMIVNHYKDGERIVNEIVPIPLLKKEGVPAFARKRSRHRQQEKQSSQKEASQSLLRFRIATEQYALPSRQVHEVIEKDSSLFETPSMLPKGPIRGAAAVRGEIVKVLDFPAPDRGEELVILQAGGEAFGIEVDEVYGIDTCESRKLSPLRGNEGPISHFYHDGTHVVAVLDPGRLGLEKVAGRPKAPSPLPSSGREPDRGFLLFSIGNEEYALPISVVRQVIETDRLPRSGGGTVVEGSEDILFLTTWNHQAVQVVTIASRLGLDPVQEQGSLTIFLEKNDRAIGFLADEISDILFLAAGRISLASEGGGSFCGALLLEDRLVPILDADRLLGEG